MDYDQLKLEILRNVAAHDGEWYWYQLDRAIIAYHPYLSAKLMPAIKDLAASGLIDIRPNKQRPDLQVYFITPAGREILAP